MAEETKIDNMDAKILRALLSESRTSFTAIADECGITVAAVRMRYKNLWKDGIINGEKMLVNPHCLGYPNIVDLGIVTDFTKKKSVASFLGSKPYISQVTSRPGKYSFYGKVALRNLDKLHEIIEDLEENQDIKKVEALIWSEAAYLEYPQNLVIGTDKRIVNPQVSRPVKRNIIVDLDETDRKIAIILANNSRTSFEEIAEQLQITPKTVARKYKKLKENLFTLSTITVDLKKIGYNALGNMYATISSGSKISEIKSQLLEIPNVIVMIKLIGPYDLYFGVVFENFEKMFETDERIRKISGVESIMVTLGGAPRSWPLNLFPSLLENDTMQPKFWRGNI